MLRISKGNWNFFSTSTFVTNTLWDVIIFRISSKTNYERRVVYTGKALPGLVGFKKRRSKLGFGEQSYPAFRREKSAQ